MLASQCLNKNNSSFWKAEARFPNFQKRLLCGIVWLILALTFKLPIFKECNFLYLCMFEHMQKCLKEQCSVYCSRLLSWSYGAFKFLGLFWTSSAGLSALYSVSCVMANPGQSYKSVSQILTNLSVRNFYLQHFGKAP